LGAITVVSPKEKNTKKRNLKACFFIKIERKVTETMQELFNYPTSGLSSNAAKVKTPTYIIKSE
jgi:hypothetical protein